MSDTVLEPFKSTDPEGDTRILWELAIRRVTDAKREDEVPVPDEMMKLGLDIAARAALLSKEALSHKDSKEMLADLYAKKVYSPLTAAARINSLFAFRDMRDAKGKRVTLATLNKALKGLHDDPVAPIDYSSKGLHQQTSELLKTIFALAGKYTEFEREKCVTENSRVIVLNPAITMLVKRNPNRYEAIIELIGTRRISTYSRVTEMLTLSEANAMMDGAL